MSRLAPLAHAYLEAAGFKVCRSKADFLDMERAASDSGACERILVWTDDEARTASALGALWRGGRDASEKRNLESFDEEMRSVTGATGFYLVESRQGLSQQFISEATRLLGDKGGIRTPIEFFDASYRIDNPEARRARSTLADLLTKAEKSSRIAQPFFVRRGLGTDTRRPGSGDLVAFLEKALAEPARGPRLHIIEGSAGSGKTVAFNALVASLYRGFIEAKRARRAARRPVVFLPGHLRSSKVGYVNDVIAAMAHTDVADVATPEQFKWLLINGYALWMFDGLDEFYDGSPDFFAFIEAALSAPGSRAQFIICTRDSLLSSNATLRHFVERHLGKSTEIEVYDLAPWTKDAWREMAALVLEPGGPGSSKGASEFVAAVEKSKEISALAGLPFYCSLLIERFKKDGALPKDEFDALEFLVDCTIDREHGKDIFRWRDYVDLDILSNTIDEEISRRGLPRPAGFSARAVVGHLLDREGRDTLFELIGSIAHKRRRDPHCAGNGDGLSGEDVRQLSGLANVPITFDSEVVRRLQTVMVQFAFFGPGRNPGSVDFTHEITADYLAARYTAILLRRQLIDAHGNGAGNGGNGRARHPGELALAMRNAVGTAELAPHSLFCRALTREIQKDPSLDHLFRSIRDQDAAARGRPDGVLNILG